MNEFDADINFILDRLKESVDCSADASHPASDSDFNRFILCCCAIDAAANRWIGIDDNVSAAGLIFKSFVSIYMEGYGSIAKKLYSHLRCRIVHSFRLSGKLGLTGQLPTMHLKKSNGLIVLDINRFQNDIESAISAMQTDIKNGKYPTAEPIEGKWYIVVRGKTSSTENESADKKYDTDITDEDYKKYGQLKSPTEDANVVKMAKDIPYVLSWAEASPKYKICDFLNELKDPKKRTRGRSLLLPTLVSVKETSEKADIPHGATAVISCDSKQKICEQDACSPCLSSCSS